MPRHFRPALFTFLEELAANNRREWFEENKSRYETQLKEPALQFISDFGPKLEKISRQFNAIPKASGGSLFRIYRDTRFGRDKTPYKTHLGIQFRHKQAKDVHAPGFYLHVEPSGSFIGVGLWHPDGPALRAIRESIDSDPTAWKRARDNRRLRARFEIGGESLTRPPRGYADDHPMIDDLKRKDFILDAPYTRRQVTSTEFLDQFAEDCRSAVPWVRWLCRAIDVPF